MTESFGKSLAPAHIPGSYLERMATAFDLIEQGELDQAATIVERVIDRIGRVPESKRRHDSDLGQVLSSARIILSEIRARQDDWEAVDALCQQVAQLEAGHATAWLYRPWDLRIDYGKTTEGLAGLRAIAEHEPDNFDAWMHLTAKALEVGDYTLADYALQYAQALAPLQGAPEAMADVQLSRFYWLWRQQQYRAAREAWETALTYDPEVVDTQDAVVRMLLEAGQLDDALHFVDNDVLVEPLANYFRAWIANQRGDTVRARHLWRRLIEIKPHETGLDLAGLQAMAHCWLRQPEAALALLLQETAEKREVHYLDALVLALAWAMAGDLEAARANLKLASKQGNPVAHPTHLLGYFHWLDFEYLVEDEAIKAELRPFFDTPHRPAP